MKQQDIRYDTYSLTWIEWLTFVLTGACLCAVTAYVFYRSLTICLMTMPLCLLYPALQKRALRDRRREALRMQFKDGVTLLASSLSAGYSIENALSVSIKELVTVYGKDGMIVREFTYMAHQISVNRTVEAVFAEFGRRSGLEDVKQFSETFAAAKRGGGDLASMMEHTAAVMAAKLRVREEILTMTAEKRFEQKVMNLLPFLIILYIDMTSPGFFDVMYQTFAGRIVMTVCLAVYAAALLMADRILDIEV